LSCRQTLLAQCPSDFLRLALPVIKDDRYIPPFLFSRDCMDPARPALGILTRCRSTADRPTRAQAGLARRWVTAVCSCTCA
jgi:hypothetical protein